MEIKLKHRPETLEQENDLVKEYVESIPKFSNFYDLGACVGTYSILAFSKEINTFCFEVDKVNYDALVENIDNYVIDNLDKENYSDLDSFNIGISDKEGEIELRIGQPEIGGHHKTLNLDSFCGHPNAKEHNKIVKVQVDSLDNLIKKHQLPNPDHIKVDIDGSEYAFILGAKESLSKAKSIIIELYDQSEYFNKIVEILEKDHMFKLYKTGIDLEPGLRDYWFKKEI